MDGKKRLLILIPRMNGGGAERVVSILANHLCMSDKYEIRIATLVDTISFYPLDRKISFQSANLSVNRRSVYTRYKSLAFNFFRAVAYVRKQIKQYKPDIVFSLLIEMDIITFFAKCGIKRFVHICSERNDPTRRRILIRSLLNWIYMSCDMFVCQSETVAKYYNRIPVSKKMVIPNPVDFSIYPERVQEGTRKRIVAVGRLRPQKNFGLLLDSFASIADEYPDIELVIYGDGIERKNLEVHANALGIADRVMMPGMSQSLLLDIRDASLFVMSSDYEGFPNALVEAIALGIPVISTDFATGVAREIITDSVGIVVPCGDRLAMSDAMKQLLDNPVRRKRIREFGYQTLSHFSIEVVLRKWDSLIEELLKK